MDVDEVFEFMNHESLAVPATVGENGQPEELEIVFDTVNSSRKYRNLKKNARVAWVVGCTTEVTEQYEGVAEELEGELKYKRPHFAMFSDGPARESWPGITYFVVRPKWGCGIATTIRRRGGL